MKRNKSLSSILGTPRVRKSPSPRKPSTSSTSPPGSVATPTLPTQSPRRATQAPKPKPSQRQRSTQDDEDDAREDYFGDRLADQGLERELVTDQHLRDVPQAMLYILSRMWTPVPASRSGMGSVRVAEVLGFRRNVPPVVSLAHLQAVLFSPTAVEREVAELVGRGVLRRVVVRRRSEAVVLVRDLERWVEGRGMEEGLKGGFLRWVKGEGELDAGEADRLVRAGWVTSEMVDGMTGSGSVVGGGGGIGVGGGLLGTRMRLEHVAKAPTGSLDAVASTAVGMVTGSGTPLSVPPASSARKNNSSPSEILSLAIPGNGTLVKLTAAALEHLKFLLGKSTFNEMPEDQLREAWDGGLGGWAAKRARGEYDGVTAGRTKKWRDFYGLGFGFVLGEAVGRGVVEVFETGSVGRGVRLV